jgi:hypothetical protein
MFDLATMLEGEDGMPPPHQNPADYVNQVLEANVEQSSIFTVLKCYSP